MYDRRSELVHGTYDVDRYDEGKFVSAEEIEEWAAFVRRALLAFLTFYFRGDMQAERNPILNRIADANFDDVKGDTFRSEADIEKLMAELAQAE
jgi:hypothetical protein